MRILEGVGDVGQGDWLCELRETLVTALCHSLCIISQTTHHGPVARMCPKTFMLWTGFRSEHVAVEPQHALTTFGAR